MSLSTAMLLCGGLDAVSPPTRVESNDAAVQRAFAQYEASDKKLTEAVAALQTAADDENIGALIKSDSERQLAVNDILGLLGNRLSDDEISKIRSINDDLGEARGEFEPKLTAGLPITRAQAQKYLQSLEQLSQSIVNLKPFGVSTTAPQHTPFDDEAWLIGIVRRDDVRRTEVFFPYRLVRDGYVGAIKLKNGDEVRVVAAAETTLADPISTSASNVVLSGIVLRPGPIAHSMIVTLKSVHEFAPQLNGAQVSVTITRPSFDRRGFDVYVVPYLWTSSGSYSRISTEPGDHIRVVPNIGVPLVKQAVVDSIVNQSLNAHGVREKLTHLCAPRQNQKQRCRLPDSCIMRHSDHVSDEE